MNTYEYGQPTKRVVQILDLYDDPELIAAYRHVHSDGVIWQEILDGIHACGILEMEIYIKGHTLVMICDLPLNLSWEEAMQKMAAGPRQEEWEAHVAQYQKADANARSDEKWQLMERMFHVYQH